MLLYIKRDCTFALGSLSEDLYSFVIDYCCCRDCYYCKVLDAFDF